ncbi:glycosyltransferase [Pseudoroseomonas wenyumeiae]|uniref:Glycosyltransferase n=1 Tax=Teichococcus wenyumeiae TaxID=2478470 RepID=A0A3A9JCL2_9PROT|nr:glycosyltransferase family 1 protein [Pseudoroseomonas wenyumeiae]RKK01356.1 glycosyltransferase family 1 protein [Pseudoroseomonas wenyumeiae]RMI26618.1 glycosyltransferase [Pseudoroseomonas wenyumeiae]
MHVILDVSRLLVCGHRPTPSGIDRVELAYARRWLQVTPGSCSFVAQDLRGGFAVLPRELVAELVAALSTAWAGGTMHEAAKQRARSLGTQARGRLLLGLGRRDLARLLNSGRRMVFLLVSHRALERRRPIEAIRRAGAAFVPLIHDIIPVTHPEYARPGQAETHRRRMASTGALADGIIVNSVATAEALRPFLAERAEEPPTIVAPLGIEAAPAPGALHAADGRPYFVTLGTIEPRKNHLLLLHLWRDMAALLGSAAPRLVIVGKRGWENENVVDILERCTALDGLVEEAGQLPDRVVADLVRGARALLFPSFAEGYGLPLAEALALRVPTICSDLPALHEVGGAVPDYLDPLDGRAWRHAVMDYMREDSPLRAAQMARMNGWRAPSWEDHFSRVDLLLEHLTDPLRHPVALPGMVRRRAAQRAGGLPGLVAVRDAAVS